LIKSLLSKSYSAISWFFIEVSVDLWAFYALINACGFMIKTGSTTGWDALKMKKIDTLIAVISIVIIIMTIMQIMYMLGA